ncbi:MAG: mechanosensitive ion channel family protein [Nannocystaceae bacterium]
MDDILRSVEAFMTGDRAVAAVRAVVVLVGGFILARILGGLITRTLGGSASKQRLMLARRLVVYSVVILSALGAMRELGFDLGVLLGAAGILTVAIGFASQTSASNLISGLFLIFEQPFVVGDIIEVGGVTGEVLSVDLLSVKLRTFDNLFVRVPSETLIKATMTNYSRFPVRRFDMLISVARGEDMKRVQELLKATAAAQPLVLIDPPPNVFFQGFGESSTELKLVAWAARETFFEMRNTLQPAIKAALDEAGVRLALPHRVLMPAPEGPLRVEVVGPDVAPSEPPAA